jgi:hypothetical protein
MVTTKHEVAPRWLIKGYGSCYGAHRLERLA